METIPFKYTVKASDNDGDALTFHLDKKPEGMDIDKLSGVISWTPAPGQAGGHAITVRVNDGFDGDAFQPFTLKVDKFVSNAPVITTPANRKK
jgi:hypothetical protein